MIPEAVLHLKITSHTKFLSITVTFKHKYLSTFLILEGLCPTLFIIGGGQGPSSPPDSMLMVYVCVRVRT